MKCGLCGMDHEKARKAGAERSYRSRVERLGEPFETICEGALFDPIELRAVQGDSGAWEASVYAPQFSEIPDLEVGSYEFVGIAATEDRAKQLARDAAATALRKWAGWREKWDAERAERAKLREDA